MAITFSPFRTTTPQILCSAAPPNPRNPDPTRKTINNNNWWAPLFGCSTEPDYITGTPIKKLELGQENESGRVRPDKDLFRGCFTEEKAKELRRKTMENENFQDVMYHSAIAARLASDVSGGKEG